MRTATALAVLALSALPARADSVSAGASAFQQGDYQRAVRAMRPPAKRGNPVAQTYMGYLYQTGRGVPQFRLASADWYQRAAEQGNPVAQYNLGLLYDKGHGVRSGCLRTAGPQVIDLVCSKLAVFRNDSIEISDAKHHG